MSATGGGDVYCSLNNYIKNKHKNLAEAIDALCVGWILSAKGGGKSLLLPSKQISEIVSKAGSKDDSKMAEAHGIIRNMVISGSLLNNKGTVHTFGGLAFKVSGSGDSLTLSGAADLKLHKSKDFTKASYVSKDFEVWEVVEGKIPSKGGDVEEEVEETKQSKAAKSTTKKSSKKGGDYAVGGATTCTPKSLLEVAKNHARHSGCARRVTQHVLSYLLWCKTFKADKFNSTGTDGVFARAWYVPEVAAFSLGIYCDDNQNAVEWAKQTKGLYLQQTDNFAQEYLQELDKMAGDFANVNRTYLEDQLKKNESSNPAKLTTMKAVNEYFGDNLGAKKTASVASLACMMVRDNETSHSIADTLSSLDTLFEKMGDNILDEQEWFSSITDPSLTLSSVHVLTRGYLVPHVLPRNVRSSLGDANSESAFKPIEANKPNMTKFNAHELDSAFQSKRQLHGTAVDNAWVAVLAKRA
jgi:hypothetical protein